MHGISGGLINVASGGEFSSGFFSGMVSSIVASSLTELGTVKVGDKLIPKNEFGRTYLKATMIAAGGLTGGISAAIAGGNFWNGMRQGLITAGLNHVFHLAADGWSKKYDVDILEDFDGASGAGHQGMSFELKDGKRHYFANEGTNQNLRMYGKSKFSNKIFNSNDEINKYYKNEFNGKYDIVAHYRASASQIQRGINALKSYIALNGNYCLVGFNCSDLVSFGLFATFQWHFNLVKESLAPNQRFIDYSINYFFYFKGNESLR